MDIKGAFTSVLASLRDAVCPSVLFLFLFLSLLLRPTFAFDSDAVQPMQAFLFPLFLGGIMLGSFFSE